MSGGVTNGVAAPVPGQVVSKGGGQEAERIDGKKIGLEIQAEVRAAVEELVAEHQTRPGLAVVIVGERKDSQTYVAMKKRAAEKCGIHSVSIELPGDISEPELVKTVEELNERNDVHGILVQLPLPDHINEQNVLTRIKVSKDVDGFLAENIGNLALKGGSPPLAVACTPAGCVELLQRSNVDPTGKHAVIVGRSNIVGMPMFHLLLSMNATVTVVHSRTPNPEEHIRRADIVVAALGKPNYIKGNWLKKGCVVIDVGINAVPDSSKKSGYRLVGDVDFAEAVKVASKITPVPGGVGPMTIAMLMRNTLNLYRNSLGLERIVLRKRSFAE